jgi:hypothetical protein
LRNFNVDSQTRDIFYYQKLQSYTYEFNPIRESIARFLNNKDCSYVSNLNQEYSKKTWIVLLKRTTRNNEYINVNETSWSWIVKYQKLKISRDHRKFFGLEIPIIGTLEIEFCDITIRFPKKLQTLHINDCRGKLPNLSGITDFVFKRRLCQREVDPKI